MIQMESRGRVLDGLIEIIRVDGDGDISMRRSHAKMCFVVANVRDVRRIRRAYAPTWSATVHSGSMSAQSPFCLWLD